MNMRLLGARTIDELVPEMVDASALSSHVVLTPQDNLFHQTCKSHSTLFMSLMGLRHDRPAPVRCEVPGQQVVTVAQGELDSSRTPSFSQASCRLDVCTIPWIIIPARDTFA